MTRKTDEIALEDRLLIKKNRQKIVGRYVFYC